MKGKIINLEINEISPQLLLQYINNKKNKNSYITKLFNKNILKIYKTKALDISKKKLYPSQTWASFYTGKPYSEHRCYWYSDPIDKRDLIWNKLVESNYSVGIINSVHSSKIPKDLFDNKKFRFYLPDCFGDKNITKPRKYKKFQFMNNYLVGESARITGILNIFKIVGKFSLDIMIAPRNFGLSKFSLYLIFKIFYFSIRNRNKELIRMAQFPLIASIFVDLIKKNKPDYSSIFSNHVAGNMHRYWYAHDNSAFKNKEKYSRNWITKNKNAIYISIDLLDDLLKFIHKTIEFRDCTICITSSMGQEPNPDFDKKFLGKYDGKIIDMELFLKHLSNFQKKFYDLTINYNVERNMAPQYGFSFDNFEKLNAKLISESITKYLAKLGLNHKLDINKNSFVLTIDPSVDNNFQTLYSVEKANKKFSKFGFHFFAVEDHHSGSHCPDGLLALINPTDKLQDNINKSLENENYINYLKVHDAILTSF
tara:strand:+ start:3852 stop:5297 length:1446 start_codon:yes stop_codon:yes gene_type:complete